MQKAARSVVKIIIPVLEISHLKRYLTNQILLAWEGRNEEFYVLNPQIILLLHW